MISKLSALSALVIALSYGFSMFFLGIAWQMLNEAKHTLDRMHDELEKYR